MSLKMKRKVSESEGPAPSKKHQADKVKKPKNEAVTFKSKAKSDKVVTDSKPKQANGKKSKVTKTITKDKNKPSGSKVVKGKAVANATSKPPDWAKFKKEKKQLRVARRRAGMEKDTLDVVTKAKSMSEQLRRKKGTPEERVQLTKDLHDMLNNNNHYTDLALAHDTTRIIQWLLKFSSVQIREEISKALTGLIPQMILSKYARNCVKRILKYGSASTRDSVINALHGNIVKFASHTMSAPILDYVYGEIASKKQQQCLKQEFYGDIYRATKDESVTTLKDTYKGNPEMKNAMLGATKAHLLKVLNKNVHDCSLIHAVLYEYLTECNSTDRSEMITTLSPLVAPLSNSKFGAKAAIICVWHGTNKDKKVILKVVKEHAVSLATHEHGHLLILSILATVDDTVLLNKVLLSVLMNEITNIAKEEWGRKVLLWMVAPRDKAYFHPSLVEWLDTGIAQGNSKKPTEQRSSEILKEALSPLCKNVQENVDFWLSNSSLSLTTAAILKSAHGDILKETLDSLSKFICNVPWTVTEDEKQVNAIEHAGIHLSLKKIAQHDKINTEKGEYTFGKAMCETLTDETVKEWVVTNRGCFLLITLLENNSADVQNSFKSKLSSSVKILKKQTSAGAKILLKKIT